MGSFSIWHWLIVLVVVLILFGGRGKVSQLMGDFGRGLNAFKKSMREDDENFEDRGAAAPGEPRALPGETPRASGAATEQKQAAEQDRAPRS